MLLSVLGFVWAFLGFSGGVCFQGFQTFFQGVGGFSKILGFWSFVKYFRGVGGVRGLGFLGILMSRVQQQTPERSYQSRTPSGPCRRSSA